MCYIALVFALFPLLSLGCKTKKGLDIEEKKPTIIPQTAKHLNTINTCMTCIILASIKESVQRLETYFQCLQLQQKPSNTLQVHNQGDKVSLTCFFYMPLRFCSVCSVGIRTFVCGISHRFVIQSKNLSLL